MDFIQRKCENCGGTLTINPSLKEATCPFCGSIYFAKASDENSSEGRLMAAEAFLKLGKYQDAGNEYSKVTKLAPQDYRGWWGLVLSSTKEFSYFEPYLLPILRDYINSVKSLAPAGTRNNLVSIFQNYISSTKERKYYDAKTFMEQGLYSKAENEYKIMTELDSQDYRGWWGLIVSKSNNFSCTYNENTFQLLESYIRKVEQYAPKDIFEGLMQQYNAYRLSLLIECEEEKARQQELDELSKMIRYFDEVQKPYDVLSSLSNIDTTLLDTSDTGRSKKTLGGIMIGVGAATFYLFFIALGRYMELKGLANLAILLSYSGLGVLVLGIILINIGKKKRREYEKNVKHNESVRKKEKALKTVSEHYNKYGRCKVSLSDADPKVLRQIYQLIYSGKASTISEALNIYHKK